MKPDRKPTIYQALIRKFIIPEFFTRKYFWGNETRIAKQLIKKYSQEFMEWVPVPFGYKITSLVYFLTGDGKNYLSGQYFEYLKDKINLTPPPKERLENQVVLGDNVEIKRKPKSLQEFLKI